MEVKKEIIRLLSGNSIGATLWSDARYEAPMLPEISPVQKCPTCGHFFLLSKVECKKGNNVSFEKRLQLLFNITYTSHLWGVFLYSNFLCCQCGNIFVIVFLATRLQKKNVTFAEQIAKVLR